MYNYQSFIWRIPCQRNKRTICNENTEESSTAPTPITETVSQLSWTYIITAAILIGIIILGIVMVVKYSKK